MLCVSHDLSYPTKDRVWATQVKAWNLNQWATRELPNSAFFFQSEKENLQV